MSGEESSANATGNLSGKYKLDRNENFDAFLAANGKYSFICSICCTFNCFEFDLRHAHCIRSHVLGQLEFEPTYNRKRRT